ncbi:EAL domain-containing protein [Enterobacteriaceae bacterium Kacie_13]|nr:EAL domain-containing protein [Enterobacteriaceae bacterium Kacie_13]
MRTVKRSDSRYLFEPIVTVSGGILGFELVKKSKNNEYSLEQTLRRNDELPGEKIKKFFDQVTMASLNADVFINNGFLLSIRIDYEIACHIVNNTAMRNVLQQHSYIRLAISEFFPEFSAGEARPVLHALSRDCPLWLDSFGEGNTSLALVMNEKFEQIKISKQFFWQHQGTISFRKVIEHLSPYTHGVIIGGIENARHIEYLKGSNIQAMQGKLWTSYNQEELIRSFF